jgi:hypothetical protein
MRPPATWTRASWLQGPAGTAYTGGCDKKLNRLGPQQDRAHEAEGGPQVVLLGHKAGPSKALITLGRVEWFHDVGVSSLNVLGVCVAWCASRRIIGGLTSFVGIVGSFVVVLALLDAAVSQMTSNTDAANKTADAFSTAVENDVNPGWVKPVAWLAGMVTLGAMLGVGLLWLASRNGSL